MFIKKITIQNFRLFPSGKEFTVDDVNVPDSTNEGSGLTVFVGENGCGKTSLLDAFSLPLLSYKGEKFSLEDFYDPKGKTKIEIFSKDDFEFAGTMPNATYKARGFSFEAGTRVRDNKAYLSSIVVSDQKFIRADNEQKPKDGSSDLRVSVNNPFSGQRFNENDVLFLDKNRLFQTRSGTYNTTRFDRLMEDFDLQYIKAKKSVLDNLNDDLNSKVKTSIANKFLENAITKFKEISNATISLEFIDNWRPFNSGFFAQRKVNNQHISLSLLGSGYEMIFSLLYSFYLSQQSEKQLIVLIDEPELHLHPALQEKFVKILLEFSKMAQIILTTHSPLLIKQLFYNNRVKTNVLVKNATDEVTIFSVQERLLPFVSANEINFLAFGLATEEYHNELYEELKLKDDSNRTAPLNLKDFDTHFFQNEKSEPANYPYNGTINQVSIHTHLRTQIHHRGTAGQANIGEIKQSIERMRGFLKSTTTA